MDFCTFPLFLGAAELAMILRVWVIYKRSRLILCTLLILLSLTIIFAFLATVIDDRPGNQPAAADQILNFSICGARSSSPTWTTVTTTFQIVEGATLLSLMIFQFVWESLQMYRETGRWQINRYMNIFVKQGILYFFAVFCFSLINVLAATKRLPEGGWQVIPLSILENVPMYTLGPRFIMSIRKMHARDVQGRRGSKIDTAFGLYDRGADGIVVFVDVDALERIEETPTTTRTFQLERADMGKGPEPCSATAPPHSGQPRVDA
ncbi:hypothetical protein HD554DRAFT_2103449 [Boletus coccyginus]|nr:hypothetical protein HD554DRAFT_2103449 [Boletus coccyginus]